VSVPANTRNAFAGVCSAGEGPAQCLVSAVVKAWEFTEASSRSIRPAEFGDYPARAPRAVARRLVRQNVVSGIAGPVSTQPRACSRRACFGFLMPGTLRNPHAPGRVRQVNKCGTFPDAGLVSGIPFQRLGGRSMVTRVTARTPTETNNHPRPHTGTATTGIAADRTAPAPDTQIMAGLIVQDQSRVLPSSVSELAAEGWRYGVHSDPGLPGGTGSRRRGPCDPSDEYHQGDAERSQGSTRQRGRANTRTALTMVDKALADLPSEVSS
jgi:hypothetical protein